MAGAYKYRISTLWTGFKECGSSLSVDVCVCGGGITKFCCSVKMLSSEYVLYVPIYVKYYVYVRINKKM